MKTWEMIKELTENPHKRFKYDTGVEWGIAAQINEGIQLIDGSFKSDKPCHFGLHQGFMKQDWQEVKQQVTWQEAIQAWMEGKSISCKIKDRYGAALYNFTNDVYLTNSLSTPISCEMLQSGKWYID